MVKIAEAPLQRVLIASTHVSQTNGYSKVSLNLIKYLGNCEDLEVVHYGFQRFNDETDPAQQRLKSLPESVIVHDAAKAEIPFEQGFGIKQFRDFVKLSRPDVIVIFNDALIAARFLNELAAEPRPCPGAKIITYLDTVYPFVNPDLLSLIDRASDHMIAFTEAWRQELLKQGIRTPTSSLMHGFDSETFFPIEKPTKKPSDAPLVCLNLNRNQPRKRYDLMAITMALVFAKRPDANIRFVGATDLKTGSWDVPRIFARELCKRMEPEKATKYLDYLLTVPNPGKLTDEDINRLYNEGDIGLNFAQGEGVGLTTLEHAGIGKPQICGRLGGFIEYLDDSCATLLEVKRHEYVDNRELIGGEASIIDPEDACDAILRYYDDPALRERHGQAARKRVMQYDWANIGKALYEVIMS
jgi:glycosyltransferase involved in cell wall biosynthesis